MQESPIVFSGQASQTASPLALKRPEKVAFAGQEAHGGCDCAPPAKYSAGLAGTEALAGHVEGEHSTAPASDQVPKGQTAQAVAPVALLAVPAGQGMQPPNALLTVPGGHDGLHGCKKPPDGAQGSPIVTVAAAGIPAVAAST